MSNNSNNSNINPQKLNTIGLFNNKVIEYMNFLDSIIDDNYIHKKIEKTINKIYLGLVVDRLVLVNLFSTNLYKYKTNMIDKDLTIFSHIEKSFFSNKIKISDKWENISEENKDKFWKYLKVFILLYEKISI
tara:strand:- start:184 stop:579 length:396 start_codon:yes stop_codon:yes gene_type:complete